MKSGLVLKVQKIMKDKKVGDTIKIKHTMHLYSLIIHPKLKYIGKVINSENSPNDNGCN